uniref:Putative secreted protein n=1 Tax=Panstrongylus lignarius TaxID=156445 RepID=A0A224XU62_9HEMI
MQFKLIFKFFHLLLGSLAIILSSLVNIVRFFNNFVACEMSIVGQLSSKLDNSVYLFIVRFHRCKERLVSFN